MRNSYAKNIAFSAMFTAISVSLCFFASVIPTMSLSITAIAGIVSAISLIRSGYKYSALVYIASSILAILLVPNKESAVFYIILFGHYPMLKLLIERIRRRFVVWALKAFLAIALYFMVFLISTYILGIENAVGNAEIIFTLALFVPVFILYDVCLGKLMRGYMARLSQNRRFR